MAPCYLQIVASIKGKGGSERCADALSWVVQCGAAQNKECKTGRKASNAIAASRVKDTIAAAMFQLETY